MSYQRTSTNDGLKPNHIWGDPQLAPGVRTLGEAKPGLGRGHRRSPLVKSVALFMREADSLI